tara:strand:+ start:4466 stop:4858 length:393 start_codon:yes stop_codon:yes gene_type:complete
MVYVRKKIFKNMKKNKFSYSDFSKQELESLKEYYIAEKINSMNESELRKFVYENISHQIKNTIGEEEEQEAWEEIKNFFDDKFDNILEETKKKCVVANQQWDNEPKKNISYINEKKTDEIKNEKIDMWVD